MVESSVTSLGQEPLAPAAKATVLECKQAVWSIMQEELLDHFSALTISASLMQDSAVGMPVKKTVPDFAIAFKELPGLPKLTASTTPRLDDKDKGPRRQERNDSSMSNGLYLQGMPMLTTMTYYRADDLGKNQRYLLTSGCSLHRARILHEYSPDVHAVDHTIKTICRPWFSPYSYYAYRGMENLLESCSIQNSPTDGAGDVGATLEHSKGTLSISSDSSASNDGLRGSQRKSPLSRKPKDTITYKELIMAAMRIPSQQSGHQCAACCRMFPTLRSLKTHINNGVREGFSCKVFYRKLKLFWQQENKLQVTEVSSPAKEKLRTYDRCPTLTP